MKTTLINLMVLDMFINDYPGTNSTADLSDPGEPCPEGWRVRPGYIIYEPGNFHFSQSAAEAITEGWEWHAATELTSCIGTFVVSNYITDIIAQINSCCGGGVIPTQFFTFMTSSYNIDFDTLNPPAQVPPCGAKLTFRWLGIFGTNEERDIVRTYTVYLTSADNSLSASFTFGGTETPFTQTEQIERVWPDDFIGLEDDGGNFTLVANDVVPGPGERSISDFDGGTIEVSLFAAADLVQIAGVSTGLAKIPDSDCAPPFAALFRATNIPDGHEITVSSSPFGPTHQMFINWGDGSVEQEFNGAAINASHVYAEGGTYDIRVRYGTGLGPSQFSVADNEFLTSVIFGTQFANFGTQFISLSGNQFTDESVEWSNLPASLFTLDLSDNQFTADALQYLTDHPNLFDLDFSGNNMNGFDASLLSPLTAYLRMNNSSLNALSFTGFAGTLTILELAGNNLILNPIANLSDLSNLQTSDFTDNALPPAQIDAILVQLDTDSGNGFTTSMEGQTPAAPPTATGLAAKASLEGKGWTVNVDV